VRNLGKSGNACTSRLLRIRLPKEIEESRRELVKSVPGGRATGGLGDRGRAVACHSASCGHLFELVSRDQASIRSRICDESRAVATDRQAEAGQAAAGD
jgi:hypothetical protein